MFIGIVATLIGLERLRRALLARRRSSRSSASASSRRGTGGFSGRSSAATASRSGPRSPGACYSVAITPLMRRYSPFRDQLARACSPAGCRSRSSGSRRSTSQTFHFTTLMWVCSAYAVDRAAVPDEHPLVHGDRQGRPVAGVAVLELPARLRRLLRDRAARRDSCTRWEIVGGALILGAVLVERSRQIAPVEPPGELDSGP